MSANEFTLKDTLVNKFILFVMTAKLTGLAIS